MSDIYKLMSDVMGEVRSVGKDGWNENQRFKFRGIDATVNAVGPALRKHGVVVVPEVVEGYPLYRDTQTTGGKATRECTVRVKYTFYAPDGSSISAVTAGESLDSGDKGTAKAMSVAFRIALLQSLALPTDEKDPDADSYERAVGAGKPATKESLAYPSLSKRADEAKTNPVRKGLYYEVSDALRNGELTPEEAEDLHNRLRPLETMQRAKPYLEKTLGAVEVELPEPPNE